LDKLVGIVDSVGRLPEEDECMPEPEELLGRLVAGGAR